MSELLIGLAEYFVFYNTERPHQSMSYGTPDQVYRTASGCGVMIVDKFGGARGEHSVPLRSTENSPRAEAKAEARTEAKKSQNRGSAVPLHVKGYPLKLDALLS